MASISVCFAASASARHLASSKSPPPKPSLLFRSPADLSLSSSYPASIPLRIAIRPPSPRVLVVRSSVEFPAGIRPGGVVETDRLPSDVRNRAMEAVDSYGGRVTIGDVASRAGLKLDEAERALQALAADTGGFLEVSDEGDVLYVFPRDYRSKLAAKSLRMKIEPLLDKLKEATAYLIRVSFGTALIASIVIVYTTIIALITSRSDEDNRGRRGGRSYDSNFTVLFRPSDLFWYWDPYYYRRRQMSTDDRMNFVESVFSFVFGDGNPNQGIEEERWKLIGEYITSNGGVVTAEELAPYLDVLPAEETADDESFILPVLLRYDGHPEVDDEGNILYRFPSLQRTASSQRVSRLEYVGKKWARWVNGVERYFKEKKWQFSKTGPSEKAMVIGLGALNLFGVVVLDSMLRNTTVTPRGFISFVADLFPLLRIYAAAFFAIPLFRWFLLRKTNVDIEKRNRARQQRAQALELPDPSLRRKLVNARDMARRTVIGSDRIVYSTEEDTSDQDYEGRDWDRRFRELERSD
ncbi:uncharacterized protein At5g03900, chloroplastic isoform X2 [Phoenix dactylifera]|uniref:Uncharacterized protein At5g03900, chloroplastic isoform X2 n=1 Tax=Phoenix dactylifera TaxID=42345 RepID=A0A8B7BY46_PHODC|nr:uncharacterized protein At5g03900, chloroplastic isoform X2 [Phoenix dactylifera]